MRQLCIYPMKCKMRGCNVNVTTICMQLLCDLFSGVLVRGLIFFAAAILRLLLNLDMIMGMLNFVLCVLHGNLQLFVDTHIFFVIKANANSMIIIYSYAAVYKSISSTNNWDIYLNSGCISSTIQLIKTFSFLNSVIV